MKKLILPCLAAALLLAQPAHAQRRGTGVSTLAQPGPTPGENSPAAIAQEQEKIDASANKADAKALSEMEQQDKKAKEALTQEKDDLTAEEGVSQPPLAPAPLEGGPDSEPASDMPAEDGLPTTEVSPDEVPDPNTLIPDEVAPPDLAPAPPVVSENKFEKERKLRIRYQEVKVQALKDQAIRGMRERADLARTDEDKRAALREYYRMLFAKITAIDEELADKCSALEQAYLRRLGQYRVEPTIPMNPPPTPEPLAN